ncbi:MAG: DNA polymerase IV [bacterium]|jgi:DNA polymerase IV|nr:DNA polymerase IV [bacterium]
MVARKILHIDLDAFFCSVEELYTPELKGKPFAVGGSPEGRGVVASCSYAARMFGVHSAMPMGQALRLCPNLTLVPTRSGAYGEASDKVFEYLESITPHFECVSVDEGYLDATDLDIPGEVLALRIQETINSRFRLPCSFGVASSKLVAKIANDCGKKRTSRTSPPNSILSVGVGEELAFLAPLPITSLIGVGEKTALRLAKFGIYHIGHAQKKTDQELRRDLGSMGAWLYRVCRGIDDRVVQADDSFKSISKETTFDSDTSDEKHLLAVLLKLSEGVGARLRNKQVSTHTLSIKFRLANFDTVSRQTKLFNPTNLDRVIFEHAKKLFYTLWKPGTRVRLLGVGAAHLLGEGAQLSLLDNSSQKMQSTIDSIRLRFGKDSIQWGRAKE